MEKAANRRAWWVLSLSLLVGIGGLLYGYDIGVISGALLFINKAIPMTDTQLGIIVGAVLGGSLIGTLLAGPLADFLGRRTVIGIASVVFIVGVLFVLGSHSFSTMLLARICLGCGVGIVAVAVPLYITEIAPARVRGKYVTFFQLFLTLGIVLAYFVDLAFTPSGNWRAMFGVVLIPAAILLLGLFRLPETPRFLMKQRRHKKARDILRRTHGEDQMEAIAQQIQQSLSETKANWRELFSAKLMLPLFVAVGIAVLNQTTGINAFLQYAPALLKKAGLGSNVMVMLGSGGIGMINFICTIVAMMFVDRIGRRPLLLVGIAGLVLSEMFLGVVSDMHLMPHTMGVLSLLGLFGFIFFYAIGPGIVVWLAISELFPTKVRGTGIALCLFFNCLVGTILSSAFLDIIHAVGMAGAYWMCAGFSVLYFLLSYYFLPETRNKSLEQIQEEFAREPVRQQSNEITV